MGVHLRFKARRGEDEGKGRRRVEEKRRLLPGEGEQEEVVLDEVQTKRMSLSRPETRQMLQGGSLGNLAQKRGFREIGEAEECERKARLQEGDRTPVQSDDELAHSPNTAHHRCPNPPSPHLPHILLPSRSTSSPPLLSSRLRTTSKRRISTRRQGSSSYLSRSSTRSNSSSNFHYHHRTRIHTCHPHTRATTQHAQCRLYALACGSYGLDRGEGTGPVR